MIYHFEDLDIQSTFDDGIGTHNNTVTTESIVTTEPITTTGSISTSQATPSNSASTSQATPSNSASTSQVTPSNSASTPQATSSNSESITTPQATPFDLEWNALTDEELQEQYELILLHGQHTRANQWRPRQRW